MSFTDDPYHYRRHAAWFRQQGRLSCAARYDLVADFYAGRVGPFTLWWRDFWWPRRHGEERRVTR